MTEMQLLELEDMYVAFASAVQQYGATKVLSGLRQYYPQMYHKLVRELPNVPPPPAILLTKYVKDAP